MFAQAMNHVNPSSEVTLLRLVDLYIDRHARKSLKTWRSIRVLINRYVGDLAGKSVAEITTDDAEALHIRVGERGEYAANRLIQHLKSAWNRGIAWGVCPAANPFAGITLYRERARDRFLSSDEIQRLLAIAEADRSDIGDFASLCLLTMARKSNVLAMRWDQINFEAGTWIIPETKNGDCQVVPLSDKEIAILNRRTRLSPWVFPSESAAGHLTYPEKSFRRLLSKAGIADCRIHDLRRSGAAAMANANVNVALIQSALNHKSVKTTLSIYARTNKRAELDARLLAQKQWFN